MAAKNKTRKTKQTAAKVRESLVKQLDAKNANASHFLDLIDDYMALFVLKNALEKDIESCGIKIETKSASGFPITKQNPSIKDLVMVNKQMLTILDKLKLTTDEPTGEVADDDLL